MATRLSRIAPPMALAGLAATVFYVIFALFFAKMFTFVQDLGVGVAIGVTTFVVGTLLTVIIGSAIARSRA